jgi:hypothetical protein
MKDSNGTACAMDAMKAAILADLNSRNPVV